MLGQSWKGPDVGLLEQVPDPPAQPWKPDLMRLIPISATVGPVTIGGKIFLSHVGLVKEAAISSKAQMAAVPMMAPYPCGQGSLFPAASVGQKPVAYIWAKAPLATGMVAKDVPTTEIKPVPMK